MYWYDTEVSTFGFPVDTQEGGRGNSETRKIENRRKRRKKTGEKIPINDQARARDTRSRSFDLIARTGSSHTVTNLKSRQDAAPYDR